MWIKFKNKNLIAYYLGQDKAIEISLSGFIHNNKEIAYRGYVVCPNPIMIVLPHLVQLVELEFCIHYRHKYLQP